MKSRIYNYLSETSALRQNEALYASLYNAVGDACKSGAGMRIFGGFRYEKFKNKELEQKPIGYLPAL